MSSRTILYTLQKGRQPILHCSGCEPFFEEEFPLLRSLPSLVEVKVELRSLFQLCCGPPFPRDSCASSSVLESGEVAWEVPRSVSEGLDHVFKGLWLFCFLEFAPDREDLLSLETGSTGVFVGTLASLGTSNPAAFSSQTTITQPLPSPCRTVGD